MPKHDPIDRPQKPRRHPAVHLCSFSCGTYRVQSPSGKTGLLFDDSDRFGPSKCHPRTGDLSEISERLGWFWDWYPKWREAGRPLVGKPWTSPIGDIHTAALPLPANPQDLTDAP